MCHGADKSVTSYGQRTSCSDLYYSLGQSNRRDSLHPSMKIGIVNANLREKAFANANIVSARRKSKLENSILIRPDESLSSSRSFCGYKSSLCGARSIRFQYRSCQHRLLLTPLLIRALRCNTSSPITREAEATTCAATDALDLLSNVTSDPSPRRVIRAHSLPPLSRTSLSICFAVIAAKLCTCLSHSSQCRSRISPCIAPHDSSHGRTIDTSNGSFLCIKGECPAPI